MVKQKISIINQETLNPHYLIEVYQINRGIVETIQCNVVKINGIKIDTNKGAFIRKHEELIDIQEESNTVVNIEVSEYFGDNS